MAQDAITEARRVAEELERLTRHWLPTADYIVREVDVARIMRAPGAIRALLALVENAHPVTHAPPP